MDVPSVYCPACGEHMRLRNVVPDAGRKSVLHFDCDCGFIYSMSARAKSEYRTSNNLHRASKPQASDVL